MGKAKLCLKRIFIFFSFLLGVLGCAVLIFGVAADRLVYEVGGACPLVWICVLAAASIFLSCLGAYGAQKEKPLPLTLFLVAMAFASFVLLAAGIRLAVAAPEMKKMIKTNMLPIQYSIHHHYTYQASLMELQMQNECCGLTDIRDFGFYGPRGQIPESCRCSGPLENCKTVQVHSSQTDNGRSSMQVYSKLCGPILQRHIVQAVHTVLGLTFGFCFMAMLGFILSITLLCQITGCDPRGPGHLEGM